MDSLRKEELKRIRKVNRMREIADSSDEYKLSYFPGANLMLLKRKGKGWIIEEETGPWFDDLFEKAYIQ